MPRGGNQPLSAHEATLGLPPGFTARHVPTDSRPEGASRAITWLSDARPTRQNHWPALALALIAQSEEVLAAAGTDTIIDGLNDELLIIERGGSNGRVVNTLNIAIKDREQDVARLRPLYNRALHVILVEMRRAHPSNPGHATQSWPQYRTFIDMLYALTPGERAAVAEWVWENGVLNAPEFRIAQQQDRRARPFHEVVAHLDTASRLGGAIFQAMVYAYLVADAPTLHIESHAVNTGSSRAGTVGDVDGFDGEYLILAAEAKDKHLSLDDEDDLQAFIEDVTNYPDVDAAIFARSFDDGLVHALREQGIRTVTRDEMAATVALWDPTKQIVAIKAMRYFFARIQKQPTLTAELDDFLDHLIELEQQQLADLLTAT